MSRLEGTASFEHDGKTYNLVLNNRVLLAAEEVLGYSALDACEEAKRALEQGRNPMLRTVVAIFYGALMQRHPDVTQDLAIDMFMGGSADAQGAFRRVLQATDAPPPAPGSQTGNGPRAAKPPSKRSGIGTASSAPGVKAGSRRKSSG